MPWLKVLIFCKLKNSREKKVRGFILFFGLWIYLHIKKQLLDSRNRECSLTIPTHLFSLGCWLALQQGCNHAKLACPAGGSTLLISTEVSGTWGQSAFLSRTLVTRRIRPAQNKHIEQKDNVFTWNLRIMVQIRPRVSLWFPSTISWDPIFSRCTLCSFRNWRALSTFSKQWMRILPFVGLGYKEKQRQ